MISRISTLSITAIISGGQTGVDRAALDFAISNKIPCGGWCPKGRRSDDGRIPEKYPLRETGSPEYAVRTRKNIQSSDGTLIIAKNGIIDRGTRLTQELCKKLHKPCLIAGMSEQEKQEFARWLLDYNIRTLNIAGCRESSQPGIYEYAMKVLKFLFG